MILWAAPSGAAQADDLERVVDESPSIYPEALRDRIRLCEHSAREAWRHGEPGAMPACRYPAVAENAR